MTLPARQQHALDTIDDVLQSAEPRLAMMFGVFADLTRLEAMPAKETLAPGPWWTRYRLPGQRYRPGRHDQHRRRVRRIVLIPLLMIAAVSLVVVSLVSAGPGGRRGCGQAVMTVMGARVRTTTSGATGTGGTGTGGTGTGGTGTGGTGTGGTGTGGTGTAAAGTAADGTDRLASTGCRPASAQLPGGSG